MVDAELSAIAVLRIISRVKIRAVHVQNAVRNITALCAAHREEGAALQLERLSTHQMDDVWTDFMHFSAVPSPHGIFVQSAKILVIALC